MAYLMQCYWISIEEESNNVSLKKGEQSLKKPSIKTKLTVMVFKSFLGVTWKRRKIRKDLSPSLFSLKLFIKW